MCYIYIICVCIYVSAFKWNIIAQLAGAVEYTDCWGVKPLPMSALDMTLNNLMVWFQWCWSFGEFRAPIHWHCSQVRSGLEW